MFRGKTQQQITLEALNHVASQSAIGNLSPGSKARALVEAVAQVVGQVSQNVTSATIANLLPNAAGTTLDLIAETHGIQRLRAVPAQIEAGDNNLKYYVRSGTFGSINGGAGITIPGGTRIFSDRASSEVMFVQRADVTLPAGSSEVAFAADQIGTITGAQVPTGGIARHDFNGYLDAAFRSLLVTNAHSVSGRPTESDVNLRFRVRNAMVAGATSNATALRIAALQTPGVSDVRLIQNRSGLGTVDVVVFGISPLVSNTLLSQVQARIKRVAPVGVRATATAPRIVGISLRTTVRFEATTSPSERATILAAASSALRRYLNDLRSGSEFRMRSLIDQVLGASPKILDLGLPGQPFEELLVWRQHSPTATRFSRKVERNFIIQDDEEVLAEPFIEQPIQLTGI